MKMLGMVTAGVAVFALTAGAWITHCATQIVRLIHGSPDDAIMNAVILVGGAVVAPLGMVHGWLIWLGIA